MTTFSLNAAQNCWLLIKDQSVEVKLWLINKLSASIINKEEAFVTNDTQDETTRFINEFAGAWKSNLSPEEIIEKINEQ